MQEEEEDDENDEGFSCVLISVASLAGVFENDDDEVDEADMRGVRKAFIAGVDEPLTKDKDNAAPLDGDICMTGTLSTFIGMAVAPYAWASIILPQSVPRQQGHAGPVHTDFVGSVSACRQCAPKKDRKDHKGGQSTRVSAPEKRQLIMT